MRTALALLCAALAMFLVDRGLIALLRSAAPDGGSDEALSITGQQVLCALLLAIEAIAATWLFVAALIRMIA